MQLQRPSFAQTQKFGMNPQIFQSIKLMELPIMELREKIGEELERNPALEILEDRSTVSLDAASEPGKEEEEYFESSSDPGLVKGGGDAAADEQRRFIEGALSRSETLQEHLLWQLRLEPVDEKPRRIAEVLIQNLDEDGFHKEAPELLLEKEDPRDIKKAQTLVQGLDPVGTCCAGYLESLRVQMGFLSGAPEAAALALEHLELLERGKFAEASRLLGLGEDEVINIFEMIKELSPFPGRRFASGEVRFVVPDIQVIRKEGEFVIILNEEEIPVLGINPFFMKIAGGKAGDAGDAWNALPGSNEKFDRPVRDFARENIREARWFINSINQRNHTLLRVSRAIVEFQRLFFIDGPKCLSPLTLKDIADELGIHETTVSRTANGKYMQTEWGIFEIRYFFSNSISGTGSGGSRYSKEGVKAIIREIIESENKRLSDHDISELLAKWGISLARRTVAKYRAELDLGTFFER